MLAAEKRGGESLTMGDALAELLADITEAAATIGTILQTAGNPNATVPGSQTSGHFSRVEAAKVFPPQAGSQNSGSFRCAVVSSACDRGPLLPCLRC